MGWELVIFDCDGVLVDSERVANRLLAAILTEAGWPMTAEDSIRTFMGLSEQSSRRIIDEQFGRPMPQVFETFYARLYDAFEAGLTPIPGIERALAGVAAAGWASCVASSGSHEKMAITLRRTGLWDAFAGRVFSANEVARGKPHPDLYLHAASMLGAAPSRCAVVEDSPHGVEGGRAAGMHVFGFADLTPAARLAGAGACVFTQMEDLPELLLRHAPG
jgi:HAD superfamily hydrolase (TIGR01509 family)